MNPYEIIYNNIQTGKYIRDFGTFSEDLKAIYGLANHPKFTKAYSMAWERGHSSGLVEVLINFDDLAELLRD